MLFTLKSVKPLFIGTVLAGGLMAQGALAQPRPLTVTPSTPSSTYFTDSQGNWQRVPVDGLFTTAPQYNQASGVRLGRGTVIPNWIETAPLRNVSIRGLRSREYYGYFLSPDQNLVLVNPSSRRVTRVISVH
ncbi:MAG: hypothetical protein JWL62_3162 [Hyphomicrobiales bacterium]|nr:hypothetical protein [Hyphomicrobiales bacterium]